jgi:hypothetical protein
VNPNVSDSSDVLPVVGADAKPTTELAPVVGLVTMNCFVVAFQTHRGRRQRPPPRASARTVAILGHGRRRAAGRSPRSRVAGAVDRDVEPAGGDAGVVVEVVAGPAGRLGPAAERAGLRRREAPSRP